VNDDAVVAGCGARCTRELWFFAAGEASGSRQWESTFPGPFAA
jgi:hypothetical protein